LGTIPSSPTSRRVSIPALLALCFAMAAGLGVGAGSPALAMDPACVVGVVQSIEGDPSKSTIQRAGGSLERAVVGAPLFERDVIETIATGTTVVIRIRREIVVLVSPYRSAHFVAPIGPGSGCDPTPADKQQFQKVPAGGARVPKAAVTAQLQSPAPEGSLYYQFKDTVPIGALHPASVSPNRESTSPAISTEATATLLRFDDKGAAQRVVANRQREFVIPLIGGKLPFTIVLQNQIEAKRRLQKISYDRRVSISDLNLSKGKYDITVIDGEKTKISTSIEVVDMDKLPQGPDLIAGSKKDEISHRIAYAIWLLNEGPELWRFEAISQLNELGSRSIFAAASLSSLTAETTREPIRIRSWCERSNAWSIARICENFLLDAAFSSQEEVFSALEATWSKDESYPLMIAGQAHWLKGLERCRLESNKPASVDGLTSQQLCLLAELEFRRDQLKWLGGLRSKRMPFDSK